MKNVDPPQRQKRKKQTEEREGGGKKGENKIKLESVEERRARLREKQVIQREASNTEREFVFSLHHFTWSLYWSVSFFLVVCPSKAPSQPLIFFLYFIL